MHPGVGPTSYWISHGHAISMRFSPLHCELAAASVSEYCRSYRRSRRAPPVSTCRGTSGGVPNNRGQRQGPCNCAGVVCLLRTHYRLGGTGSISGMDCIRHRVYGKAQGVAVMGQSRTGKQCPTFVPKNGNDWRKSTTTRARRKGEQSGRAIAHTRADETASGRYFGALTPHLLTICTVSEIYKYRM
jgi:hypothetical protein